MSVATLSKKTLPIILVLLVSALAIFWDLGKTPKGMLVDEASLGYNAYSVLKTGKDEWGEKLPLTLKSFGDYKPAGYIYFAIPYIKLFGLSILSVRLPSAFGGLLSVLLLYLITKSLFKNGLISFICALLLATSPWFIYMSRMAWEANLALTLFLAGVYFLVNFNKRLLFLFLSAFFFSLSLYVYVGYKIATPLFLIFFSYYYFYRKKLLDNKSLITYLLIFLFFLLPFIYETVYKGAATRFSQVNIFNQAGTVMFINEQRAFCGMQNNKILSTFCYLFWNKPTVTITDFLKRYLSSFSTDFLFFTGDQALFINNPDHGGLYFWLLPFFVIGVIKILRDWRSQNYQLIMLWLLISPIMPSIAGKPHFVRSNMLLIPVIMICAVGVLTIIKKKTLFKIILIFVLLLSLSYTMTDYLFVYTKKAMAWDDYYLDIYKYLQ
ncbi:MAG: glycosyltransferase family 39 protein, partial [Candidatus Omnitrophica bacterium]|nr:glycosyltransferase family 39 protein [Candidatus Omnitrophota bacterium]